VDSRNSIDSACAHVFVRAGEELLQDWHRSLPEAVAEFLDGVLADGKVGGIHGDIGQQITSRLVSDAGRGMERFEPDVPVFGVRADDGGANVGTGYYWRLHE
jgi:hypothetical protein